jgi:hypothetical protein
MDTTLFRLNLAKTTALGALCAMASVPVGANADPPAVGAPAVPAVFVGAPTNDSTSAGEFVVNFASNGTYERVGIPPEPALVLDLTPRVGLPQARAYPPSLDERASADRAIVHLKRQLRENQQPTAASLSAR